MFLAKTNRCVFPDGDGVEPFDKFFDSVRHRFRIIPLVNAERSSVRKFETGEILGKTQIHVLDALRIVGVSPNLVAANDKRLDLMFS